MPHCVLQGPLGDGFCSLPADTGPCRASIRRWHWDASVRRCRLFMCAAACCFFFFLCITPHTILLLLRYVADSFPLDAKSDLEAFSNDICESASGWGGASLDSEAGVGAWCACVVL